MTIQFQFKTMNGKCTSNKAVLTKTLNKFQELVNDFAKMDQDIPQLSKIRKADLLCAQVEKIWTAQTTLEGDATMLIELVWQLPDGARSKDQAGTQMTEQQMVDNIENSMATNQERADLMLKNNEDVVVAAEKILQA